MITVYISARIINTFGISSSSETIRADRRNPNPPPMKLEIDAIDVARKCSDGLNHTEAIISGDVSIRQLIEANQACPKRATP
jgi:hypothetical protein